MIPETDIAYAAGLFDGEGSVTINSPQKNRGYTLFVSVSQKNRLITDWLHELWPGYLGYNKRNDIHRWMLSSRKGSSFLETILPYLKGKKEVAKLGIELQNSKRIGLRNTPEYLEFCKNIKHKIIKLNGRHTE